VTAAAKPGPELPLTPHWSHSAPARRGRSRSGNKPARRRQLRRFGGFRRALRRGGGAASRAARSIASICLDCCSTARSVNQLVSRLISTVRLGAGSVPLSATITAGRTRRRRWRRVEGEQSIEHGVGEIDVDGRLQIGAVGLDDDVAQPRLPGADADRRRCLRHRQAGIVERATDEFANAIVLGRNPKLDSARDGAEHLRVEAHQPRLFERDGAEAGQRADESGGTAADTFDLGLQRQTAGRRRAIGAGKDRAELGVGEPEAKPRRETAGAVCNGETPVEAAFAQSARDILEHDLRTVEPRHSAESLRHQPRREHCALRLEGDAAVQTGLRSRRSDRATSRPRPRRIATAFQSPPQSRPVRRAIPPRSTRRSAAHRQSATPRGPAPCCRRSFPRTDRNRASPADRTQTATCPCRRHRSDRRRACLQSRSSRPSGPFADTSSRAGLLSPRRRDRDQAARAAARTHRPQTGRRYGHRRRPARPGRSP
jgi:hypothetical protein